MIINTHGSALNSLNLLKRVENGQSSVLKKLGSGKRINTAADDATGIAMKEAKQALIRGSEQASRNTQDGISLTQTAQGGIDVIQSMAQRLRELVIEAGNDTLTSEDRNNVQVEIDQINEQITKIAKETTFNGKTLLATDDNSGEGIIIHVSSQPTVQVVIERTSMTAEALGFVAPGAGLRVDDAATASNSISIIDDAINNKIAGEQAKYGAYQNRFNQLASDLRTYADNVSISQARLVDVDMAAEAIKLAKYNILNASTNLMLVNAKQKPENVLNLLNG